MCRTYFLDLSATALLSILIVVVSGISPADAQQTQELNIGDIMPMPDRPMKRASGGQVSLSDVEGERGTLVVFWSNACPWVERYEQRMIGIGRDYQPKGIGIIAVNANDPTAYPEETLEEMRTAAAQADYPFPYVADPQSGLARAFGATRTPQVFLFDHQRELVYMGAIDDNPRSAEDVEKPYLRNALSALIGGETIRKRTSKTFGCTIKWQ